MSYESINIYDEPNNADFSDQNNHRLDATTSEFESISLHDLGDDFTTDNSIYSGGGITDKAVSQTKQVYSTPHINSVTMTKCKNVQLGNRTIYTRGNTDKAPIQDDSKNLAKMCENRKISNRLTATVLFVTIIVLLAKIFKM